VYWHVIFFPNVCLPQMPSRTRAHDGAGTSRGQEDTPNPPPVPPTLAEAIASLVNVTADNIRFLREMAGNQFQQHGGRAPPQGPCETSYMEFSKTCPPLFVKAEDPVEADEWIRVIEQKFGLVHCTETQKLLFAAQQLRGPASSWWANFVAVQPARHKVTWDEFKLAFCEHYVLEGVLHMKQEEFIRLKQGGDTVMEYINKFYHLSQYAIDQVNTDLKKKNCFMRGLNDRSNHGPEKRTSMVIRPFNQNRFSPRPPPYPFKQPVFIRPTTAPTSTNQPSASGAHFPALPSSSTGFFNYGKSGHFIKDCPYSKQNKFNNQQNSGSSNQGRGNMDNSSAGKNVKKTGRIYYNQVATTPEEEPVMMGTFLVTNHPAVILFDSGASHTLISKKFMEKHCIPCTESREGFIIHSLGGQIFTKEVVFHVPITLAEREFPTNMIVLKGQDIDVILGMNWLAHHKAILNTDLRTIKLSYDHEEVLLSIPVAIPARPFG
jgi:hypothetical protein